MTTTAASKADAIQGHAASTPSQTGGLRPGDIDLSDPETFVTGVPHAYFRVLREQAPVHWQAERTLPVFMPGPGFFALTRYADVTFVSKNPDLFSSAAPSSALNDLHPREQRLAREQLIQMDPPDHSELRNLMNVQFKPRAVHETEAHMRRIVSETLDGMASQSQCDFVADVSAPISLRVLTNFLGVPDAYTARFYRWTNEVMRFGEPGSFNLARARFALLQIFVQSALLARKRRKQPTADVFSSLVNGEFHGAPLTRMMTQVNFFLLMIAGNETTRNALSGGIQALCEHPEQFDRLRRDPALLPQAIEEILRWVSPVMQFRRTAMRDTKLGDQAIRKGDKVVMYYGAANRDAEVFADPEVFDITRKPNPHLAFGVGTHFCMGSHIARLEMRVTLEEFLRRYPNVSLAGAPERLQSNFISGIKRLPVSLV
jgi:cholest-4-en-3-one 26-monooxygenase